MCREKKNQPVVSTCPPYTGLPKFARSLAWVHPIMDGIDNTSKVKQNHISE